MLFHEHILDAPAGIDRVAEDIGEHLAFGETLVLRIVAELRDHGVEQVLLVLAVHDGEAGREARGLGVAAEQAVADGVEGAAPQPGDVVGQEVRDAVEHLARGFVGEGQEQDVRRRHAILHEVGHAIGERPRLPAARARDDQRRPRRGGHGGALLRVEFGGEINARSRGGGALERVLAGHDGRGLSARARGAASFIPRWCAFREAPPSGACVWECAGSLARPVTVADAQSRSSSTSIALTISAGGGVTKISTIQGTISDLYNLTRFASGATVTVISSGHALPASHPGICVLPTAVSRGRVLQSARMRQAVRVARAGGAVNSPRFHRSRAPIRLSTAGAPPPRKSEGAF